MIIISEVLRSEKKILSELNKRFSPCYQLNDLF